MTDPNSFDRNFSSEPEPGESDGEAFDFYEYDKQRRKMVKENLGVEIILSQVRYMDADGQLVTESSTDYTRHVLIARYPTLETFLTAWFKAERRQTIVAELYHQGVFIDKLQEQLGTELDPFDLICLLAFERKALTRRERANRVRSQAGHFDQYGEAARRIVDVVLAKFAEDGYITLDKMLDDVLLRHSFHAPPFDEFESPRKVFRAFGGKRKFRRTMREILDMIYQV